MPNRSMPRNRDQWRTANCEVCGKEFKTSRYDTTTCSSTCRSRKSRAEAQHRQKRESMVVGLREFTRFEGRKPTKEDIEALQFVERWARDFLLGYAKQQRMELKEFAEPYVLELTGH